MHGFVGTDSLLTEMLRREPDATKYLGFFRPLIDSSLGIIRSLDLLDDYFHDEPKFRSFRACLAPTCHLSDGGYTKFPAEGGRSQRDDQATIAAIFEGVERYSLSIYRKSRLIVGTYDALKTNVNALDPAHLCSFEKVAEADSRHRLHGTTLSWAKAWSCRANAEIYVPAQSVFLPYVFPESEPVLRDPLTTGAASGLSYGGATLRGLLEVIERDAMMLFHYKTQSGVEIDPATANHENLSTIVAALRRYRLDVQLLDIRHDHSIPVVCAIIRDPTGTVPAATFGTKASFDPVDACIGALLEAALFRRPMRDRLTRSLQVAQAIGDSWNLISSAEERAYVCIQPEMVTRQNYRATKPGNPASFWDRPPISRESLAKLFAALEQQAADVIVAPVTTPDIASFGIHVVKVVVPGLQHMHLCEPDRAWSRRLLTFGEKRSQAPLSFVDRLNPLPHPFN